MNYSTKISERLWNQPDKGELEAERELTFIDDIVQKAHIERELLAHLDGIRTAFDGGAGCGRFSILLAKQGIQVTHFDISQPMLDKAKELASQAGVLDRIAFVKGALEDLSAYGDHSFDLVISFDAPISYTYPNQERTIRELVRIAKKRIMISVSSRLGALPYLANPIQKNQFILDRDSKDEWVRWCLRSKDQMIDSFSFRKESLMDAMETGLLSDPEEARQAYDRGETPWCVTYHFMPEELKSILENCGVRNIVLAGPGAFARTIPNEILVGIMRDPDQRKAFLEFCHLYDSRPSVCGLGKDNLFARGEIKDRVLVLFSGFPTHHFTDKIAEKLREEIPIRDSLVFVSAWPSDFDRNDDDAAGMHEMFSERGMGFSRFSVIDQRTDQTEAGRMIREASCVFLMGGNATLQMRLIHEKHIYDALRESSAVILGVSAGSMNMGKNTVDIRESLVPYEGLGFADITMIGHFSYEDTERLRLMKAVSKERPVCAMEDESAVFIRNGKVDIIGIIHKIDKGEIVPFTEANIRR